MPYLRRVIDDALDDLLPGLAAIALEGAKGVGKTATARQRAVAEASFDDPAQRQPFEADLSLIRSAPHPFLIDEWQLVPSVWDAVRRAVDTDSTGGQFLLTGSANPPVGARMHSGAGRIVSMLMRPLAFSERGISTPEVSLSAMLAGTSVQIGGVTDVGLGGYVDELLRSGFPGIRSLPDRARKAQLDSYIARIVDRELPESGASIRRPSTVRAWLAAYGAATATDASYSAILDAATAGESDKPARQTVDAYRDHLQRIFVLDPLPAWTPAFAPLRRLTRTPKHHVVDPALAARMAGVDEASLLRGKNSKIRPFAASWLGALFESLVVQSVRTYAEAAGARVSHLRTRNTDHEVDIIVEAEDMSVVAIEVKLAGVIEDRDVRHLNWLEEQLGERLIEKVIVTTGPYAYRRSDRVAVVPFALLGP
jgi:predicted AAA+ superfamily ATPase